MENPRIFPRPGSENESEHLERERDAAAGNVLPMLSTRQARLAWVDVRALVDEVCARLAPRLAATGIETTIDVPRTAGLYADRDMLRSAIENLTLNAMEAMPSGGRLVVTSYCGQGGFELEIADSGPGLSEVALRSAFQPYYTTKRGGAGLGLAVVRRVAQAHHGDVVAANCPEGGAAFTLRFPSRAREAAA